MSPEDLTKDEKLCIPVSYTRSKRARKHKFVLACRCDVLGRIKMSNTIESWTEQRLSSPVLKTMRNNSSFVLSVLLKTESYRSSTFFLGEDQDFLQQE
jgi:hypothetical protein